MIRSTRKDYCITEVISDNIRSHLDWKVNYVIGSDDFGSGFEIPPDTVGISLKIDGFRFTQEQIAIKFLDLDSAFISAIHGVCVIGGVCAVRTLRGNGVDKDDWWDFLLYATHGKIPNHKDSFTSWPSKLITLTPSYNIGGGWGFDWGLIDDLINESEEIIYSGYKDYLLSDEAKRYKIYLKTQDWKNKRNLVLDRDTHKCVKCGGKATEVHHVTYERKYFEELGDLVSVCRDCHKKIHY